VVVLVPEGTWVTTTVAFAIGAPEASVITPRIPPVVSWAKAALEVANRMAAAETP